MVHIEKRMAMHDCIIMGIQVGGSNIWFDRAAKLFAECISDDDIGKQRATFDWAISALENPDTKPINTQEELLKLLKEWNTDNIVLDKSSSSMRMLYYQDEAIPF